MLSRGNRTEQVEWLVSRVKRVESSGLPGEVGNRLLKDQRVSQAGPPLDSRLEVRDTTCQFAHRSAAIDR